MQFNKYTHKHTQGTLLDIAIVNPCVGSNLGNAARHVGKHRADAVERKKNLGNAARHLYKPPYAIVSVPSVSGHAVAYRWRSLARVCRHRVSSSQGSSRNGCSLSRSPWTKHSSIIPGGTSQRRKESRQNSCQPNQHFTTTPPIVWV